MHTRRIHRGVTVIALLLASWSAAGANAQSTAFTYQGQLKRGGSPTTGPCDLRFSLFDAESAGNQIDTPHTVTAVDVTNGLFTVQLDFGATAFSVSDTTFFGGDRWLEIGVRCPAGSGNFSTLLPRQALTAAPYALFAPLVVREPGGAARAIMDVLSDGSGDVRTEGPNGNTAVEIGSSIDNPNLGFASVNDADGTIRVELSVLDTGEGFVGTRGPNGNDNTRLTSLASNPNHGFVAAQDENGTSKAGMLVNESGQGEIFADVKNFIVDHPNRPGSKIIYSSLEGPEAAIYHRGVVKLVGGRATIELPEHFAALADHDTITVQLTPGSLDSQGLAIAAIREGRIDIGELHQGKGSYDVHFVVHALRRGYEGRKVVLTDGEFRTRFEPLRAARTTRKRESVAAATRQSGAE